jgi:hypothetical protein
LNKLKNTQQTTISELIEITQNDLVEPERGEVTVMVTHNFNRGSNVERDCDQMGSGELPEFNVVRGCSTQRGTLSGRGQNL